MKREEGVLLECREQGAVVDEYRAHFFEDGRLRLVNWQTWDRETRAFDAGDLSAKAVAALTAELRRREGGEGAADAATKRLIEMGQACIDWFNDTDGCHFCDPRNGVHHEGCPVGEHLAASPGESPRGEGG